LQQFENEQLNTVNNAVAMAEELVSNAYKMSENQWLRRRYDVSTLAELDADEIVDGPFAQVIRFSGRLKGTSLGSSAYDYYKICLQDHSILAALQESPGMQLFPLVLYITTHELIHIVRFSKFLQSFDATPEETLVEENRVHAKTRQILIPVNVTGLDNVLEFYGKWHDPSRASIHREVLDNRRSLPILAVKTDAPAIDQCLLCRGNLCRFTNTNAPLVAGSRKPSRNSRTGR